MTTPVRRAIGVALIGGSLLAVSLLYSAGVGLISLESYDSSSPAGNDGVGRTRTLVIRPGLCDRPGWAALPGLAIEATNPSSAANTLNVEDPIPQMT